MDLQRALGERHPLVIVEGRLRAIGVNLITAVGTGLAALALVSLGLLGERIASATELASAIVAAALALAFLVMRGRRRELARELIAAGRDDLPIPAVRDERCRLESRRQSLQLAGALDRIVERAESRARPWVPAGYADARSVRASRNDLICLAELLRRAESPCAQAAAQIHRLITDGPASPLYASDPVLLEQELGRIRYLLEAA